MDCAMDLGVPWCPMVPNQTLLKKNSKNMGGRSKEAHPPKPMPSFASGDISARRSSWLSISIYLQNFWHIYIYLFIHRNEMYIIYMYIYIYICVCVCVYPFWIVIFIARTLYPSFPAMAQIMNQQNWEAMGPLLDKASHGTPKFEEPEGWEQKWSVSSLRWWIGSRLMNVSTQIVSAYICIASIEFYCWNPSRIQVTGESGTLDNPTWNVFKKPKSKKKATPAPDPGDQTGLCALHHLFHLGLAVSPHRRWATQGQALEGLGGATNSCPGSTVSSFHML